MSDFQIHWQDFHADSLPVAWLMRGEEEKHRLRFHSLPESKQYAETDAERRIILHRANVVATQILGEGQPCYLVAARQWWSDPAIINHVPDSYDDVISDFGLGLAFESADDPQEDEPGWKIFTGNQIWRSGAFDELIQSIADEVTSQVLWFSPIDGAVFAPYDGGVDLFLPSPEAVRDLKDRFPDWLSSHPEGL